MVESTWGVGLMCLVAGSEALTGKDARLCMGGEVTPRNGDGTCGLTPRSVQLL